MKTLYLDLFSGISGDMFLGALIDLGADARKLERELKKLQLGGWRLQVLRKQKSGIAGIKFEVQMDPSPAHRHAHHSHHHHHHDDSRDFADIKRLISRSRLSNWAKKKSVAVFRRIAEAEGKIHGRPPEAVHFHEVGAVDSIVDIVGGCVALEMLGKPRVFASPVVEGTGWIDCAHGRFPVPAPATLAILGTRGIGITQCDEPHELVTPTGAALLAEFAERFEPMKNLVAAKIGFGLGSRKNKTRPNVLRAVLGKSDKWPVTSATKRASTSDLKNRSTVTRDWPHLDWESDHIALLETNLDDHHPEMLGHFMESALAAGALDIFYTPIQMKKNRPGVLLSILCGETEADKFSEMILRETTAFGVRRTIAERRKLRREFAQVRTPYGKITVKLGKLNGKVVHATPEYESCKKQAVRAKIPLKRVYEAANQAILAS